jgi:hypothetical protein
MIEPISGGVNERVGSVPELDWRQNGLEPFVAAGIFVRSVPIPACGREIENA